MGEEIVGIKYPFDDLVELARVIEEFALAARAVVRSLIVVGFTSEF